MFFTPQLSIFRSQNKYPFWNAQSETVYFQKELYLISIRHNLYEN